MSESYNFESSRETFFNHLLLELSDSKGIDELVNSEDYDSDNLQVELKINGVILLTKDFNKILDEWENRIADSVRAEDNYISKDQSATVNAENLLKLKLGEAYDALSRLQDLDIGTEDDILEYEYMIRRRDEDHAFLKGEFDKLLLDVHTLRPVPWYSDLELHKYDHETAHYYFDEIDMAGQTNRISRVYLPARAIYDKEFRKEYLSGVLSVSINPYEQYKG